MSQIIINECDMCQKQTKERMLKLQDLKIFNTEGDDCVDFSSFLVGKTFCTFDCLTGFIRETALKAGAKTNYPDVEEARKK